MSEVNLTVPMYLCNSTKMIKKFDGRRREISGYVMSEAGLLLHFRVFPLISCH